MSSLGHNGPLLTQPRIRHITSLQVRNLTPFPARDAFASALVQPTEQAQFSDGHFSDDLDITLSRRRSRRISATSIGTLFSLKSDDSANDEAIHGTTDARGRKPVSSKVRANYASPSAASPPSVRSRQRTSSLSSSMHSPTQASLPASTSKATHTSSNIPFSQLLPDHSQSGLSKILRSRLVETFLCIFVLQEKEDEIEDNLSHNSFKNGKASNSPPWTRSPTKSKAGSGPEKGSLLKHRVKVPDTPTKANHSKKLTPTLPLHSTPSAPFIQTPNSGESIPDYLSPVHPASINPIFSLDPRLDFAKWQDLSGARAKIELWANASTTHSEIATPAELSEPTWKLFETWTLELENLVPLTDELPDFPPNTLVVTLFPPGQSFYLPPILDGPQPLTTDVGYSSDPESDVRKAANRTGVAERSMTAIRRRQRRGNKNDSTSSLESAKTATWQDLFKLVTAQSTIIDTESSLSDVIEGIDRILQEDESVLARKRQINVLETRVNDIRKETKQVREHHQALESEFHLRRELLRQRQEMLPIAQRQYEDAVTSLKEKSGALQEERVILQSVQKQLPHLRTGILAELASIYPIELFSPPDLLFTILDIPLPIPVASTDPAPPLSMVSHKEVTDEAVATALGYAAQVVQLLAAYLGKSLVYPVTCVGSRSLIRDGISAMVGPRMFPLFSRGVDTYRFEYGVFLLNKNIELLMSDYDLRALDMRHTLPNIKNLLLILTSGEPESQRRPSSPALAGLESPRTDSTRSRSTTPKTEERSTISGTTTSPATTETVKKTKPFLGLSFPSAFLRGRQMPSSTGSAASDSATDDSSPSRDDDTADDGDRHTIRGVVLDGKPELNGSTPGEEKLGNGVLLDPDRYIVNG